MSLTSFSKIAVIGLGCGLLAGATSYFAPSKPESASSTPTKISFAAKSGLGISAKANQSIEVQIRNLDDLPDSPDESMRLEVSVTSARVFDQGMTGEWRLPAGVVVTDGTSQAERIDVVPGETWTRIYSFKGITQNSGKILQFEASGNLNGQPIGGQGVFSSHPVQKDLSRRALPKKERGYFSKAASDETQSKSTERLPAGIQF